MSVNSRNNSSEHNLITFNQNVNVSRKRKNFFDCVRSQKLKNKNLILMQSEALSQFCSSIGLKIDEIILSPKIDGESSDIKITILQESKNKSLKAFYCLKAKDETNLSCRKYTILKKTLNELNINTFPNIKVILNLQNKLNNFFQVQKNENGFFIEPVQKIKYVCEKFLEKNPGYLKTNFKIKLSADSTVISRKHLNLLNFTFCLLDDVDTAMESSGCFILGMYEIEHEKYEELNKSLKEILNLLEKIKFINIGGKAYSIEFFIGADYKMLRLLYGQKSSNAAESCVWCRFDMRETPNTNEEFRILRNLNDKDPHLDPLIKFIPFEKCVVDLLHLLLRITDQLYNLLLLKLARIDKNNGKDIEQRPNLKIFVTFLKTKCKISNPYYVSNEEIKLRSFNGNERIRIFEELYKPYLVKVGGNESSLKRLSLGELFKKNIDPPYDFKFEDYVWFGFYEILNKIKSFKDESISNNFNPKPTSIPILSQDLKNWLKSYLFINEKNRNSKKITPYIHVFVFHIPQFIELHKDLNLFNTQGLEKLNDFCTQYYHLCTNKHNENKKYLGQLINKRNRIEFFKLQGKLHEFQHSSNSDNENYVHFSETNSDSE